MSFLPDLDQDGQLLKDETEDDILMPILQNVKLISPMKYQVAMRGIRNEGWSVRKALDQVGILVGIK